jgi:peptide deformylase
MTRIKGRLPPPPGRTNLTARPLVLRLFPDAVLRKTARPLGCSNAQVEVLARDMLALMQARRGIGLAAPQIGLPVRLIVADIGDGPVCLVDPALAPAGPDEAMEEGCLSLPGIAVEVKRAAAVEARGLDPAGRPLHFKAQGLLARVLQHEVDHLDGILIIDRAPADRGNPSSRGRDPAAETAGQIRQTFL